MKFDLTKEGNVSVITGNENNTPFGKIEFIPIGNDLINIIHTEVNPAFEGKGMGGKLVHAAVDYANKNGLKIKLSCSFAKVYFDRHPQLKESLA